MKYAVDEIEKRLWLLGGELYSGYRLGAWCYNASQELFHSTNPNWKEFQMFLKISGILDHVTSEVSEEPHPSVYTDDLGLLWIGERVNLSNNGSLFVLCGPAYIKGRSREAVIEKLSVLNLSVKLRMKYATPLSEIPVLGAGEIGAISRMLHFTIYDEFLQSRTLHFTDALGQETASDAKEKASGRGLTEDDSLEEYAKARNTTNDFGRMAEVQKTLLDYIRSGAYEENPEKTNFYNGEFVDYGIKDELRTLKNNMIIFMDRCAEAAIEGGLPVLAAKQKERQAIMEIEKSSSLSQLANVNWQHYLGFVDAVHRARKAKERGISEETQVILNYILNHCREPLTLEQLARKSGYSEYYFSRKFTKETGMKIGDYIKQTRINLAKIMLTSTRKSIFQIAEELQFKSRSHFDRTFFQMTGSSPAQYRESMGRIFEKKSKEKKSKDKE